MRADGAILEVDGETIADAGEGEVSAAIEKVALSANGHVTVTRPGGFFLEAAPSGAGAGGQLSLACGDARKGQRQFATAPVSPAEARALFGDFLGGGDAWRRQCKWRSRGTAASRAAPAVGARSSVLEWLAGGGAIAFSLAILVVPVLLPAAFALALCLYVIVKAWREVQVRRWPQASGRIVRSGLQPRRRRFQREATRLDNIPALGYEFSVAGQRYVGSRLGLDTEYAGVDVGALVARYPVGAVVAVHFNPADPSDCLLDPFASSGLLGEALKLIAILGAFVAALYYGAAALTRMVAAQFPGANAPHAVFAASFGLLFLLLLLWSFRPRPRVAASLRATGRVVKSEVEEVVLGASAASTSLGGGGRSYLQPTVEVAYSVGGQSYVLRTGVGSGIAARNRGEAEQRLAPYSIGKTVEVLYAAANPGAASLAGNQGTIAGDATQTTYRLAALAGAVACFAMAMIALGVL